MNRMDGVQHEQWTPALESRRAWDNATDQQNECLGFGNQLAR